MTKESSIPKIVLFDIGGVVVSSPFLAITAYENNTSIPSGWINFAISRSAPHGAWSRLERGEYVADDKWFPLFKADLTNEVLWREFHARRGKDGNDVPALPEIDAEKLFYAMMAAASTPDAHIVPAVRKLRADGRFVVGALSNTSVYTVPTTSAPASSGKDKPAFNPRTLFPDLFISSAHSGMRKPEKRIYEHALQEARRLWKDQGRKGEVEASDVLFLDDIGENLRVAKECGWRTVRVRIGKTRDAVREVEGIVRLRLLDDDAVKGKL
jgi:epoxide hydrolase-like predicted phosphatase